MAPTFQRPLDLGADICMTSGTKFVGGHGDVTLGLLTVKGPELAKRVYFLQNAEGAGLAPFDCWLALRGLKTMSLRMEKSAANAARMAAFLDAHPLIKKVNYATLAGHPGREVHAAQASSGGSLLSFETGSVEASKVCGCVFVVCTAVTAVIAVIEVLIRVREHRVGLCGDLGWHTAAYNVHCRSTERCSLSSICVSLIIFN